MCYIVHVPKEDKLKRRLPARIGSVQPYKHYFAADGFTMPMLPVTASEAPDRVEAAMWKLLPPWVHTMADARKYANTLNAACESIFDKASYKHNIGQQRCLVWVEGFFEPHHPDGKTTVPYYLHQPDREPFSLGGVYSNWVNQETGELIKTFSIITTPANELLARIHNEGKRMPLVIPPQARDQWLGPLSQPQINELMVPLPDGLLEGYAVSGLVYNRRKDTNVPGVLLPRAEGHSRQGSLLD